MRKPFIIVTLTFLYSGFWMLFLENSREVSQASDVKSSQITQADSIDSYITQKMQARRIPGLALAVVENGKLILKKAYGIANLETDTPVKTNSVFELASVTKHFTATAILMLVEDGKVRLDDPISTYISNSPDAWKSITVKHLLTHTAGLRGAIVQWEGSALKPMNSLTYITSDEVEGRGLRISEPISRICYYKGELGKRIHYFTFWLTKESKVAHMRFYAE